MRDCLSTLTGFQTLSLIFGHLLNLIVYVYEIA